MRTLFLLRHAKSSWDDPALDDIDRPLAARGERDAPRMGREIAARGWQPELVLVSPARRTRQTWELARPSLSPGIRSSFLAAIYEASAGAILSEICETPPSIRALMVIGHNPGLEDLARLLSGPGSVGTDLERLKAKFPTGALARLALDGDWRDLGKESAKLTDFIRPRELP